MRKGGDIYLTLGRLSSRCETSSREVKHLVDSPSITRRHAGNSMLYFIPLVRSMNLTWSKVRQSLCVSTEKSGKIINLVFSNQSSSIFRASRRTRSLSQKFKSQNIKMHRGERCGPWTASILWALSTTK